MIRALHVVSGISMIAGALAACAGDIQAPVGPGASEEALSPAAVTSTLYVIQRLDGFPPPRRICPNEPLTLTSGSVTLRSDGTFTARFEYRTDGPTTRQVVHASGTYQVNGGTVTFRDRSGIVVTGQLTNSGARLTVSFTYCDPPGQHQIIFVRR